MIVLLNGHSLTPRDRFQPETMGLQLAERSSTASLTIGTDGPALNVGDWVQIESGPGAGIVWRVKTIETQVDRKTVTVTLEHLINTLRDQLMFGEIKTKDISGNANSATAVQTARYILNKQSDWVLGDFAYNVSNPYHFNGESLFEALETVTGSLDDAIWEYSFASYPFTIHIRQTDNTVVSEMRTDRNIRTLKRTIDRSRMYTRHYPIGKNNKHISGDYVSRNENLYGVISKTETDNSKSTDAELRAWATERLKRHCEPSVTVTISGLDLSKATGEPMDSFVIGKKCRVPLPEFHTTITEKVTKLNYTDVINEPMTVTITLANELQDVATILKENAAGGGRSGRYGAQKDEEDHAWIVDTTEKVELVAEAVAGKDGDGANWSRVSQLTVDGQGIDARVTYAEGELVTQASRITMNETAITAEVTRATTAEGSLSGRITVNADAITAEVTRATTAEGALSGRITTNADNITAEVTRATTAEGTLSGRITVNSNKVALVVETVDGQNVIKSASIVTAINSAGSSVAISADHVTITGDSKVSGSLEISDGNLRVKKSAVFQGNITLITSGTSVTAPIFYVSSGGHIRLIGEGYYDITYSGYKALYKDLQITQDGNNYKLQKKSVGDNDWVDVGTFSRATSLSGAWSGNDYVVTASPQGNTFTVPMPMRLNGSGAASNFSAEIYTTSGSTTIAKKSIYGYLVLHTNGSSSYVEVNTASDGSGSTVAQISAADVYTAGYTVTTSQFSYSNFTKNYTGSIGGRTEIGSISKAGLSANSYIIFDIKVHGTTKKYYIVVNA